MFLIFRNGLNLARYFWLTRTDTIVGRRKALESQPRGPFPKIEAQYVKIESEVPCWVEDEQTISILPASVARALNSTTAPLIPYDSSLQIPAKTGHLPAVRIMFPLSSDHLITLLQFNVLRSCLANRRLISGLNVIPVDECSSAALHVLPNSSYPDSIPPSLQPTLLQRTVPHEEWIDILPHARWRDNLILAVGTFDEDELWSDTVGGLFEGFPASESERRGVIAWSPPWHVRGWEMSEGFLRKWGWSMVGCEDVLEATNKWRNQRGEEPLVLKI